MGEEHQLEKGPSLTRTAGAQRNAGGLKKFARWIWPPFDDHKGRRTRSNLVQAAGVAATTSILFVTVYTLDLTKLKDERVSALKQTTELNLEKLDLEQVTQRLRAEKDTLEVRAAILRDERNQLVEDERAATSKLNNLGEQVRQSDDRVAAAKEEASRTTAQLVVLQGRLKEEKAIGEQLQAEQRTLQSANDVARAQLADLQVAIARLSKEREVLLNGALVREMIRLHGNATESVAPYHYAVKAARSLLDAPTWATIERQSGKQVLFVEKHTGDGEGGGDGGMRFTCTDIFGSTKRDEDYEPVILQTQTGRPTFELVRYRDLRASVTSWKDLEAYAKQHYEHLNAIPDITPRKLVLNQLRAGSKLPIDDLKTLETLLDKVARKDPISDQSLLVQEPLIAARGGVAIGEIERAQAAEKAVFSIIFGMMREVDPKMVQELFRLRLLNCSPVYAGRVQ